MLKLLFFSIWSKIKFGTLKPIRTIKSRRLITAESFIVAKVSFKFNFRLIWIKFQKNFSVLLKEEWIRSLSIRGSKDKILKNDPKNLLEKLKWILHAGNLTSHNKCSVSNRFKNQILKFASVAAFCCKNFQDFEFVTGSWITNQLSEFYFIVLERFCRFYSPQEWVSSMIVSQHDITFRQNHSQTIVDFLGSSYLLAANDPICFSGLFIVGC